MLLLGNFLLLVVLFKTNMIIAAFSILGVVLGACYMVWLYYRVALNEINTTTQSSLVDLDLREIATLVPLVLLVLMIGLQPNILLSYMHVSVEHLVEQLHNSIILKILTLMILSAQLLNILRLYSNGSDKPTLSFFRYYFNGT
ncbi:MAG: hypothetical protein Ct9H300mP29_4130 [Candidatus Neomarinimicrobiota bacterium]|nr:MAG: hypothetical protein Ct9H300mP29_4130 [Candidatus Neomarinimicrobiota bacterium]